MTLERRLSSTPSRPRRLGQQARTHGIDESMNDIGQKELVKS